LGGADSAFRDCALKVKPVVYTIGKDNGTAAAFVSFCQMMVVSRWLRHDDEIIVMDNAATHTGGESEELERFFGETIIDGRPLHILVIYLPTRSPDLNPIELVFHMFARRVISYRLRHDCPGGPVDSDIIRFGSDVLNDITYETILKCYQH
jgi:transposase